MPNVSKTIGLAVMLGFFTSCNSEVEQRRLHTLERLNYSVGTGELQSRRDTLSNAVFCSTAQSLKTPLLIEAILRSNSTAKTNGVIAVYWICDTPSADGILLHVPDAEPTNVRFRQDYLSQARADAKEMVQFYATIPKQDLEATWPKLIASGGRVALATNGKPISGELNLKVVSK